MSDQFGRRGRDLETGSIVYVDAPDGAEGDTRMRAAGVEPEQPAS
jgi:hypothetical protein